MLFVAATLGVGGVPYLVHGQSAVQHQQEPGGFFCRSWQTDDGLPANAVNCMLQDRQGFIWLATLEGLVRFDGIRFKKVTSPLVADLMAGNIRSLALEKDSSLLMLPAVGGVVRLREGHFSAHPIGEGLAGRQLQSLFVEPDGAIWLGIVGGGVRRWHEGKYVDFGPDVGLTSRAKATYAVDADGRAWIGSGSHLYFFHGGQLIRFNEIGRSGFVAVASSASGGIWIWKDTQLLKLEQGKLSIVTDDLPWTESSGVVREMMEDSTGSLWIGTSAHGLFRFANGKFARISTSQNQISSITEDHEGSIWAATVGGGINRLRPAPFRLYDSKSGLPEEVSDSVCVDAEGAVWLANRRSGVVRIGDGQIKPLRLQAGTRSLGAYVVCPDHRGGLWVSEGTYLYRFQRETPDQVERMNIGEIHVIFESRQGDIWIGTETNILGRFVGAQSDQFVPESEFQGQRARCIAEDSGGRIWIGTESGQLFERVGDQFIQYGVKEGLPQAPIRSLYADNAGSLWIGTIGGGLVLRRDGRFTRFSTNDGLPYDDVTEILEDDMGRIWCGSHAGIFHVAKSDLLASAENKTGKVNALTFGRSEGLAAISCLGTCQPMAWKARTGELWFATQQGALVVDSTALQPNRHAPAVLIDELLINDRPLAQPVQAIGAIIIPPLCRKIEFRFSVLSYAAPEKVRLRYRIEDVDSEWIEMIGGRSAIYAGLAPGNYRVNVTACNNEGVWHETGATLAFNVLPAWWQGWWFKGGTWVVVVIALALSIRHWTRRRLRFKLERLEHQQALGRERTRIARDLHDDLGASLTQVGLMIEEFKDASPPAEKTKVMSAMISSRVRTLARDLDAIVWAVNPTNDTFNELGDYLSQYFLECLRLTAIRPRLQFMEEIPEHALSPEVRHHVFLVVKEAINNVIKHSQATEATLHLSAGDGVFVAKLNDNGRGFSVATVAHSQSQGLINMRRRIEDLGGEIKVTSTPGNGTSVCIRIRLNITSDGKPKSC